MDWQKIIDIVPKWSLFKKLQNETLLKATYVWFIIVPIATKIFSKFSSPFTFISNEKEYSLILELPFQWQMLYWASFFFIVSNILYRFFAPKIIQENDHFGDFEKTGKSKEHLSDYISRETLKVKLEQYKDYEMRAYTNDNLLEDTEINIDNLRDLLFIDTIVSNKNSSSNNKMNNFHNSYKKTKSW